MGTAYNIPMNQQTLLVSEFCTSFELVTHLFLCPVEYCYSYKKQER